MNNDAIKWFKAYMQDEHNEQVLFCDGEPVGKRHAEMFKVWVDAQAQVVNQVEFTQDPFKVKGESLIDINEYLTRYCDGDVLLVSDRNKFSSKLPSGVKAHWINHTSDWSAMDLVPHKNAVTHIHEIFIDKAFLAETSEKEVDGYIKFLIKEFQCPDEVKRTYIDLTGNGILVELAGA